MADRDIDTQLTKYLTDAHSIEEQALAQLERAPDMAGAFELADALRVHLTETQEHERLVRELLDARDASADQAQGRRGARRRGGLPAVRASSSPTRPASSPRTRSRTRHLELASLRAPTRVAERAGDDGRPRWRDGSADEEARWPSGSSGLFDAPSRRRCARNADDLHGAAAKYLADAHAIEEQAIQLLERAPKLAGDERSRASTRSTSTRRATTRSSSPSGSSARRRARRR